MIMNYPNIMWQLIKKIVELRMHSEEVDKTLEKLIPESLKPQIREFCRTIDEGVKRDDISVRKGANEGDRYVVEGEEILKDAMKDIPK